MAGKGQHRPCAACTGPTTGGGKGRGRSRSRGRGRGKGKGRGKHAQGPLVGTAPQVRHVQGLQWVQVVPCGVHNGAPRLWGRRSLRVGPREVQGRSWWCHEMWSGAERGAGGCGQAATETPQSQGACLEQGGGGGGGAAAQGQFPGSSHLLKGCTSLFAV